MAFNDIRLTQRVDLAAKYFKEKSNGPERVEVLDGEMIMAAVWAANYLSEKRDGFPADIHQKSQNVLEIGRSYGIGNRGFYRESLKDAAEVCDALVRIVQKRKPLENMNF